MPNYKKAARRAARRRGINPDLFERQIGAESGFNPNAGSPAGARGIAQFMPATARGMGVNLNDGRAADDLDGAARLMASYLKKYGNWRDALTAYNAGPGRVGKPLYAETRGYVSKILNGQNVAEQPADEAEAAERSRTVTTPGVDRSGERQNLMLSYLQNRHDPNALLSLKQGLDANRDTPSRTRTIRENVQTHQAATKPKGGSASGTASFDGKKVAAWMVPILQYARERGWKGTITSGYRSDAEQVRIYNSGVRPAAKPKALGGSGSKHSETGFLEGAIDVTDPQTLDRILRKKNSRLKFAGAKDPVHFSVPNPDGSY